jgi:hypothetical protein
VKDERVLQPGAPYAARSRARQAAKTLFGIDVPTSAATGSMPAVPAFVLVVILIGFSALAWYATSIDLGFSVDGAYVFSRILDDRTFFDTAGWTRWHADVVLQWPLVLAVNTHITSLAVLKLLYHLGLYLPFILSFAICWNACRGLNNDALLLFPLAGYLLVSLPVASFLAGDSHVLAVIVWPILFLLLRPRLTWRQAVLVIALLLLMSRTYETALGAASIFLCLLGVRLAVDSPSARSVPIAVAAIVTLIIIAIAAYGALFPLHAGNRASFVAGMGSAGRHPMLLVSAGSIALLVASLASARLRLLAVPAVLLAAGSITLPLLGRTASAGVSFDLRSLTLTLLPVLLLSAIWFHYKRPRLSARQWILTGIICLLLSAGYGASWVAWRDFRHDFVAALRTHSGYVPLDDTPIANSPQRWPWTTSLLSILWSPDCVRTIILNHPGWQRAAGLADQNWEPFDPRTHLPLQSYVPYSVPLAAAAPHAGRCY